MMNTPFIYKYITILQTKQPMGIIVMLLFCIMQQQAICSTDHRSSINAQPFTYFGPTKWNNDINTASLHSDTPPFGPAASGSATWSIMRANTTTNSFDRHGGEVTVPLSNILGGGEALIFQQALDVWAAISGFTNAGLVNDIGLPFHNSAAFGIKAGDIRIGAISFETNQLAHAYAPGDNDDYYGSINGDIHFNVDKNWVDNLFEDGTTETFDFFTVALHEIGHALGLGHSNNGAAVMASGYTGAKRTLQPDDIAGIQALYGIPEPMTFTLLAGGAWYTARRPRKNQP